MGTVRMNIPGKLKYGQWKRVTVDDKGRTRMMTKIVEIGLSKETLVPTFEKQVEEFVIHVERVRKQYNEIRTLHWEPMMYFFKWTLQKITPVKVLTDSVCILVSVCSNAASYCLLLQGKRT